MTGTDASLSAEVLDDPARALVLADEWRALAESRGNAFVTPEWFESAAQVYSRDATPFVVAVRDASDSLRGVLPLATDRTGRPRAIRFAGSGLGDRLQPACAEHDEPAVAAAAATVLGEAPGPWSAIVLENVDSGSGWPDRLREASPGRLVPIEGGQAALPYTEIGGRTWDEYLADRSRSFRNQVGRKLRKLEREHEVGFRRADGPNAARADLEVLFELHRRRWEGKAGESSLTERSRSFHRLFSASCAERGWLRLYVMEIDGEPAAAWYGWSLGGRFCYYQAGLDPAHADHSAGFLMLAHAMRDAFAEGAEVFELLLGDEPFKARFASSSREVRTVSLVRASHPARLAITADAGMRSMGRRLPGGLKRPARALSTALGRALPGARRR